MEQKANCEDLNFSEKTWQLLWAGQGRGCWGLGEAGDGMGWEENPKTQKNWGASWGSVVFLYFLDEHYLPNIRYKENEGRNGLNF